MGLPWRTSTDTRRSPSEGWVALFSCAPIATDSPSLLPQPTQLPVLDLNDADAICDFLLRHALRHEYTPPYDLDTEPAACADAQPAAGAGAVAGRDNGAD